MLFRSQTIIDRLDEAGLRVHLDDRNEKIGFKIREAQMQKIPYMLVIGDKEVESGAVAVRTREGGDQGTMGVSELITQLMAQVATKK